MAPALAIRDSPVSSAAGTSVRISGAGRPGGGPNTTAAASPEAEESPVCLGPSSRTASPV
eukprot:3526948-Alexandrium_andersonii.AAC.1